MPVLSCFFFPILRKSRTKAHGMVLLSVHFCLLISINIIRNTEQMTHRARLAYTITHGDSVLR